jgi:hypothetical protein
MESLEHSPLAVSASNARGFKGECTCGWSVYAPTAGTARKKRDKHITSPDPVGWFVINVTDPSAGVAGTFPSKKAALDACGAAKGHRIDGGYETSNGFVVTNDPHWTPAPSTT